jgi:hypothetical protein
MLVAAAYYTAKLALWQKPESRANCDSCAVQAAQALHGVQQQQSGSSSTVVKSMPEGIIRSGTIR